jgi:hypothetical protein
MTTLDGTVDTHAAYQVGSVAVLGSRPVLQVADALGGEFVLYGRPGARYRLETSTAFLGAPWVPLVEAEIPAGANYVRVGVPAGANLGFVRAVGAQ